MKKKFQFFKFALPALMIISALSSNAQVNQEKKFELTTTRANTIASRVLIDIPELNDKPGAIIVATLDDNQRMSNPHPLGAWYYGGKWNLFNTDHANLPIGLKFKITYFLTLNKDQFFQFVPASTLTSQLYINHDKLDNNPNAKFSFFQIHGVYTNGINPFEEEAGYNASTGKWYIRNKGGQALTSSAHYNFVVYSPGSTLVTTSIVNTIPVTTIPSVASSGKAGGDLSGTYPDPTVEKLLGRPLSSADPKPGQVLKWSGTVWAPANDEGVPLSVTAPKIGQMLKWNGTQWAPSDVPQASFKPLGLDLPNLIVGDVTIAVPSLSHSITVFKKSRLVVTASLWVGGDMACFGLFGVGSGVGCSSAAITLNVKFDNNFVTSIYRTAATSLRENLILANYMIDLNPGTHLLEFEIKNSALSKASIHEGYSSVIVIPVE